MKIINNKLQDAEWLKDQYETQQKSLNTIALELGVTVATVSKYAKKYNISLRDAGKSRSITLQQQGISYKKKSRIVSSVTKEWLIEHYIDKKLGVRDLSALANCSRREMKRTLIHHQIPLRNLKEARQLRTEKGPEFRKTVNPMLSDIDLLKNLYIDQYLSVEAIKKRLNCSGKTIKRRLLKAGIDLRNANEANIGRKHSLETIAKMSKTATDQIINGSRSSHCNGRRVNCLLPDGKFVTMRSTWEKKYAEYLKSQNIYFLYEPRSFPLSNGKSYVADFYIPSTDEYIEIKGYLSDHQEDKYELFKQEYPDIKWKILYKESLIDLGIDLKKKLQTVYLLVGAPGAGKSWVANQLTDKFDYVSYDGNKKKEHLDMLRVLSDKPKLYDPTFKISTFIRRHSDEFDIKLIAIQEDESVLRQRMTSRGGKWTDTIMKRNCEVLKRFNKYGVDGFIGTSQEALDFLKNKSDTDTHMQLV